VPSLRDRPEDLVPLAEAIAREVEPGATLGPETTAALRARSWPGNVRELGNAIRRAVVAAGGRPVGPEHLPDADLPQGAVDGLSVPFDVDLPLEEAGEQVAAEFKRRYLDALMRRMGGDVKAVARHAGVHEKSLYRLLRRAGLKPR
jgi:two-component system, NtrC family, response regulator AtoC